MRPHTAVIFASVGARPGATAGRAGDDRASDDRPIESRIREGPPGAPAACVAGLPLAVRAAAIFARAGIRRCCIVGDAAVAAQVARDPRVRCAVVSHLPPPDDAIWIACDRYAMFDEVAVRAVVAAAGERDAGDAAGDGVAAVLNDPGGHPVLAALPGAVLVVAADRRVAVGEGAGCRGETDRQERSIHERRAHLSIDEPEDSRAAVAAHPRPLSESAGASVTHSDSASRVSGPQIADGVPLEGTLEAVLQRVAATSIRGVAAPGAFAMRATDACAVAAAERRLVACAANVRDGRLDRWLNRRVSWRLSLALARHPSVTPNRISLASIAVGLAGALLVAVGGYWTRLAGLAVIQLASVLDCVDGELARLTLRESRRGEWLDIAGDTIAHVALFVAIGLAVAADGGAHAVRLGAVLAAGALTSFACVTYAERSEAARRRAGGALNRAIDVLVAALSTRDFHAVVFVFAAADRLGFFLIGAAVGAHVWWIALLILLVLAGRAGVSVPFR